jgi:hypothetical protein
MVHDRISAGETTVDSTAAVLRCGKQMEKLPHYNFSWTVSLQKNMRNSSSGDKLRFGDLSLEEAMDLSRDRQILELELVLHPCAHCEPGPSHVASHVLSVFLTTRQSRWKKFRS